MGKKHSIINNCYKSTCTFKSCRYYTRCTYGTLASGPYSPLFKKLKALKEQYTSIVKIRLTGLRQDIETYDPVDQLSIEDFRLLVRHQPAKDNRKQNDVVAKGQGEAHSNSGRSGVCPDGRGHKDRENRSGVTTFNYKKYSNG